jgi:hypothetical protein
MDPDAEMSTKNRNTIKKNLHATYEMNSTKYTIIHIQVLLWLIIEKFVNKKMLGNIPE